MCAHGQANECEQTKGKKLFALFRSHYSRQYSNHNRKKGEADNQNLLKWKKKCGIECVGLQHAYASFQHVVCVCTCTTIIYHGILSKRKAAKYFHFMQKPSFFILPNGNMWKWQSQSIRNISKFHFHVYQIVIACKN